MLLKYLFMDDLLTRLLKYYNLTIDKYLKIKDESIDYSFLSFLLENKDFLKSKEIIKNAIKNNEKIIIYGDYDCDGIMSTSIIYNLIKKEDDYKCGFYIPFREKDGYGITKENIDMFLSLDYKLFILVDNGITLKENVDYILSKGAKVIIIDHHEIIKEKEAKPSSLIHWGKIEEINNNISAAALSFLFSYVYLNGKVDEYLLSLGGISLISDLMPLSSFLNHKIVKLALKAINKNKFNEICLLVNKYEDINEEDISSYLVPKVNSVGRIIKDNSLFNVVRYFLIDKTKNINIYLDYINSVNDNRKKLITDFENMDLKIDDSLPYLLLILDIEEGISGLLANRFLEKTNKPSFILIKTKNNTYKGSARSRNGFNVVSFLKENSDLFIAFGGHEFAGGFEFESENLSLFEEKLLEYSSSHKFIKEEKKTIDFKLNEINKNSYELISSFAPFGKDFPKPLLKIYDISTLSLKFSKDTTHIITRISFDSSLIYFNYPNEMLKENKVNLLGYISINKFNGHTSYQFKANDYEIYSQKIEN